MTLKLWEIGAELQSLVDEMTVVQEDETLDEDARARLVEALFNNWLTSSEKFKERALDLGRYIKYLEALGTARREEARRITELARRPENLAARLRGYLAHQLNKSGLNVVEGSSIRLQTKRALPKVNLLCTPEELPRELQRVKIEADLIKLKDYLKTHENCEWAELTTPTCPSVLIQ